VKAANVVQKNTIANGNEDAGTQISGYIGLI